LVVGAVELERLVTQMGMDTAVMVFHLRFLDHLSLMLGVEVVRAMQMRDRSPAGMAAAVLGEIILHQRRLKDRQDQPISVVEEEVVLSAAVPLLAAQVAQA
jgi:hypothetical protein